MMASGRSLSIAAKAPSNSSLLLILIGLIAVPVASPPSWICSRKGLEKGSVALARAVTRRADGNMSRINWTLLPASSAVTLAMPVTFPPGRGRLAISPVPIGSWRDVGRRLFPRQRGGREPGDDDIDLETDELGGQFRKPVEASLCRAKLEANVLSFDIAQLAQSLPELPPELCRIGIADDECANDRELRGLLRARGERPGDAAPPRREMSARRLTSNMRLPFQRSAGSVGAPTGEDRCGRSSACSACHETAGRSSARAEIFSIAGACRAFHPALRDPLDDLAAQSYQRAFRHIFLRKEK